MRRIKVIAKKDTSKDKDLYVDEAKVKKSRKWWMYWIQRCGYTFEEIKKEILVRDKRLKLIKTLKKV